jgi:flavin reductase (DIM6/NTAB) family NADH-FMN oxidoreductase RutF
MPDPMTDGWQAVAALLDYPMFVVTTRAGDERSGCLVGFATQVSVEPARFLIGLSKNNHTYRVATDADRLVVHLLDRSRRNLAELFGATTGDQVDKFACCDWHDGPGAVPVLDGAAAWFSGPVIGTYPVGDHVGFLVEMDAADVRDPDATLLTFSAVKDVAPGHEA